MKKTDWHIHTHNSCDCKKGGLTVEHLLSRAAEMGMTDLGISDHVHTFINYERDIALSRAEFDAALEAHPEWKGHFHFGIELSTVSEWEIARLKEGMNEEDYPPHGFNYGLRWFDGPRDTTPTLAITDEIRKKYGIEYVITGVHWGLFCRGASEKEAWDNLMRQIFFAIGNPHTDILAHWLWDDPDGGFVDPFYDFDKIPRTVLDDTADALRIYNKIFEINSTFTHDSVKHAPGWADKYLEYAASLQDKGITLSFGSDSHSGNYIADIDHFYRIMRQHGIDTDKLFSL